MNYDELVTLVEMPEWKSLLVDLVYKEFDPWDIDIALLAEKYLEKIRGMDDLTVPANAVLACAILLNFKADILRQEEEPFEPEPEETFENVVVEETGPEVIPPQRLGVRKITLDDLLTAMEKVMKARKKVSKKPVVRKEEIEQFFDNIEEEDVDELIQETYSLVLKTVDSEGLTTFSKIAGKNPEEKIKRLLPLLYLATEGKINLWQEKPFDEIFISVVENEGSD